MAIDAEEPTRRDFIILAANAFVAVGGAAALWPFIDQMNPDAGALALASIEVDITPVKEGQAITVLWRGKPVFIRHRTDGGDRRGQGTSTSTICRDPLGAQRQSARERIRRPTTTAPRRATRTGS